MLYNDNYFEENYDQRLVDLWHKDFGKTLPIYIHDIFALGTPRRGEKVLDIATGYGHLALHSALAGAQTVAIDYSDTSLRLARQTFEKNMVDIKLIKMDATKLDFDDETFDLIYCVHLIEHISQQSVTECLAEIKRVLKPNGRLVITTCSNKWHDTIGYKFICLYNKINNRTIIPLDNIHSSGHITKLNPFTFKHILKQAGFLTTLKIVFNPYERLNTIHKIILATPLKNIFCSNVYALCTKPRGSEFRH